jgi:hypothetical protein
MGRGIGNFVFQQRGLMIGHAAYGIEVANDAIKKRLEGDSTLSFILATRFIQGFEEV